MAKSSQRRIGDFTIVDELAGKGGQGRLFSARCDVDGAFPGLSAGQIVALKVMPVRGDDPDKAYRRLKRRTDALVSSVHPGIVRYWGCFAAEGGLGDDVHVAVMDLLRGETLAERLKREPLGLDAAEALRIVRTCLEALVCASGHGIVHRDLKPSNVFLCDDGGVKLIDFEIAQAAAAAQTTTESGAMQGTYDYMAPDFHPDFRPDPKFRGDSCSDVFSLSVVFHEALTGRRPYPSHDGMSGDQSMMAFFRRWSRDGGGDVSRMVRVDSLRVHALRHVQKVLRAGLSPERSGRYRSYAEMLEALSAVSVRTLRGKKDSYRLSVCVGKGGFGAVYKAWRGSDGSPVAVKFLTRADSDGRFWREARTLEKFDDDRIVSFVESFEIGRETRMPVLVMEFLPHMPGSSLKDRIAAPDGRSGLPAAEVIPAFVRFAEGLAVLHHGGVIHRDVKPANLYLPAGEPGKACLMDLGIVRTDETQTNGGLPGTPDYMAPELARSATRGDARSDIYSLGLCLFEALTGSPAYPRLPRGSEAYAAWFERARSGEKPDLSALDWYPEARKAVAKLVDPEPIGRPYSAAKAASLVKGIPPRERPVDPEDPETGTYLPGDGGTTIVDDSTLNEPERPDEPEEPEEPGKPEAPEAPRGPEEAARPDVQTEVLVSPDGGGGAGGQTMAQGGTVAPTEVADGGTVAPTEVGGGTMAGDGTVAPTISEPEAVPEKPAAPQAPPKPEPVKPVPAPPKPGRPQIPSPSREPPRAPAVREIKETVPWGGIVALVAAVAVGGAVYLWHDAIFGFLNPQPEWVPPNPPLPQPDPVPTNQLTDVPPEPVPEPNPPEPEPNPPEPEPVPEPPKPDPRKIAKEAERALEIRIDDIVRRIETLSANVAGADSGALSRIGDSFSALAKAAEIAFDTAKATEGVEGGDAFRRCRTACDDANRKATVAIDMRRMEIQKRIAAEKAERELQKTIDGLVGRIREFESQAANADANALDRIEAAIDGIGREAEIAFDAAKATEGVEGGEAIHKCGNDFDAAKRDAEKSVGDRRDALAKAAEAIRVEREKEAARAKEYGEAEKAVADVASREDHEAAREAVESRIGSAELPEAWKAKYQTLLDVLDKPFAATLSNDSGIGIEAALDGVSRRLAPGEEWTSKLPAWSGSARYVVFPADHPEDYETREAGLEIAVGKAGGTGRSVVGAGTFVPKPMPEIAVKNAGIVAAAVDVGDGFEAAVLEPGASRTFQAEPRRTVRVSFEPAGVPEALKPVYGSRETREIETGARGTAHSVEAAFSPDWKKLDIGGILEAGIAGAAEVRPLLAEAGAAVGRDAARGFLEFARESLADAGVDAGDAADWVSLQDAGFAMDAVLALDCALRLDPGSPEIARVARDVADGISKAAESKAKFWLKAETDGEYRARLDSFRTALRLNPPR